MKLDYHCIASFVFCIAFSFFVFMIFQDEIIGWYHKNKRDLPWRQTNDPYVIWLSEIILQQTRVDQGLPYFNRFLEHFPNLTALAAAEEETVLKLWQGLGYYSRARNMLYTAKQVVQLHNGQFPTQYESLINLKGIGKYTAAAISSFAANEPRAVLDGNVFRLLSRYFGITSPIDSSQGKKQFEELAMQLLVGQNPSTYNQAIMEFGALQCKPKLPLCSQCPLHSNCFALKHHKIEQLPVKAKKTKVRVRVFNYFVVRQGDSILARQRIETDIWQNMYDFPLVESQVKDFTEDPNLVSQAKAWFGDKAELVLLKTAKHQLSHQIIYVHFFGIVNYMAIFNEIANITWMETELFKQMPHPKVISDFIEEQIN